MKPTWGEEEMKALGKKPTANEILAFAHTLGFNVVSEDTYLYSEARFYRQAIIEAADKLEAIQGEKEKPDCSCDVCSLIRELRISAGIKDSGKMKE